MYQLCCDITQMRCKESCLNSHATGTSTQSLVCVVTANSKNKKSAFTLIELLVVIAIISLLVSILLPSLKKAKFLATRVACASNLRSQGIGIRMYMTDNDSRFPSIEGITERRNWARLRFCGVILCDLTILNEQCGLYTIPLEPYVGTYKVFFCPDREPDAYPCNNGRIAEIIWKIYITYNGFVLNNKNSTTGVQVDIYHPIENMDDYRCWMYDILASDYDFTNGRGYIGSHRNEGQNQLHPDGSVNWVDIDDDDALQSVW